VTMNILVREYTQNDLVEAKIVSDDAHAVLRKFYHPTAQAKKIGSDTPYKRIVAVADNKIVGVATYEVEGDFLYFGSLGVLTAYRKMGIAKKIISHIEEAAQSMGFSKIQCATMEKTGNVSIFEKIGFKKSSREITGKFESVDGEPIVEVYLEKSVETCRVNLGGNKIILRDWIADDLASFEEWQKPCHKWQDFDGPYYTTTEENTLKQINGIRERLKSAAFPAPRTRLVIADKKSNQLLGTVNSYWESIETNWLCAGIALYDHNFWGQGIGYDALNVWINYLFFVHPQIVRLDLRTWSGNYGMIHLAKKLNFKLEAQFRKARIVNGEYYDSLGFGILREEWLNRTVAVENKK